MRKIQTAFFYQRYPLDPYQLHVGCESLRLPPIFIARRCLFLVVNVDLGVPFHDLSDASSQVFQQSHEVIDLILLHQSNALALIELAHAIQEHFYELFLLKSLIRVDAHDELSPFPCEDHEATLAMIALHDDL